MAAFAVASDEAEEVVAAHATTRLADLVSLHCEAHYGRHGCALIEGTVYALLPSGPSPNTHRELVADIARRAHGALRSPSADSDTAAGKPARPAPVRVRAWLVAVLCQAGTMFSACGPFWPWVTSKATFWPSRSSR